MKFNRNVMKMTIEIWWKCDEKITIEMWNMHCDENSFDEFKKQRYTEEKDLAERRYKNLIERLRISTFKIWLNEWGFLQLFLKIGNYLSACALRMRERCVCARVAYVRALRMRARCVCAPVACAHPLRVRARCVCAPVAYARPLRMRARCLCASRCVCAPVAARASRMRALCVCVRVAYGCALRICARCICVRVAYMCALRMRARYVGARVA